MDRIILIAAFIICAITIFIVVYLANTTKQEKHVNKVHFYVARDRDKSLWLYMGKPTRNEDFESWTPTCRTLSAYYDFERFGLNKDNYKDLKWEDEPVEVFINMED